MISCSANDGIKYYIKTVYVMINTMYTDRYNRANIVSNIFPLCVTATGRVPG